MRHLKSVTIENLFSIRKLVKFPLNDLNIVVGEKGSGKSNLLECIAYPSIEAAHLSQFDPRIEYKGDGNNTGLSLAICVEAFRKLYFLYCFHNYNHLCDIEDWSKYALSRV